MNIKLVALFLTMALMTTTAIAETVCQQINYPILEINDDGCGIGAPIPDWGLGLYARCKARVQCDVYDRNMNIINSFERWAYSEWDAYPCGSNPQCY